MLVYHPMNDPYHCIYRILCILFDLKQENINLDLIRILDFYVLFPSRLKNIVLPQIYNSYKKIFKDISEPYENLPIDIKLLDGLKELQNNALKTLAAYNIIDSYCYLNEDKIIFYKDNITQGMLSLINDSQIRQKDWYKILIEKISIIEFYGNKGLKYRTKLLEYQYDAI